MNGENCNKEIKHENTIIILPEAEAPPLKKITVFLLGFGGAFLFAAYINLNESLGFIALGIILFLLFFDEGFRRLF